MNEERTKAGLPLFVRDAKLDLAAQAKLKDMKHQRYFSHRPPSGGSFLDSVRAQGITFRSAGENLGRKKKLSFNYTNAWTKSTLHRYNLLNSQFDTVGIAEGKFNQGYKKAVVVYFIDAY